jgi:hypothetical protein
MMSFISRFRINTRAFVTNDDTDPAREVRNRVLDIICSPPFDVQSDPDQVQKNLWEVVFRLSRQLRTVNCDELIVEFAAAGLILNASRWNSEIDRTRIVGRTQQIVEVEKLLAAEKIVLVSSISGMGKSSLATLLFDKIESQPAKCCWISATFYPDIENISSIIADFIHDLGHQSLAARLKQAEIAKIAPLLRQVFENVQCTFFFDGAEHFSSRTGEVIKRALFDEPLGLPKSSLIITAVGQPEWVPDLVVQLGKVAIYPALGHLTYQPTLLSTCA